MTQECSDDSSESDRDHSFLCFFGLHKWKRKSGALCCLPTVLEKRYECIRCGKYKVIFERENRSYRLFADRY
ncbi:hypothetical protein RG963_06100 [Methanosarcina sp. Z-7115]|uniref:Mobile element protein n=1 Tax=Methanosarcina baikalica TaxID=3073890 RepID=A0ABU2D039_9EURY|nr:hypothetical protein [Methanosarcina sp. Z-7115]MDR7665362.1 hypothetical protein [Methanosarcina sp. Z-7115]